MTEDDAKHPLDRDLSPGLRFPSLDMTNCRQLVEHLAQSTAVHSRSKGWLPRVKLDLTHIPLVGKGEAQTLELIIRPSDLPRLVEVLTTAMQRAYVDAEHGLVMPEE